MLRLDDTEDTDRGGSTDRLDTTIALCEHLAGEALEWERVSPTILHAWSTSKRSSFLVRRRTLVA
ncbi:hypothetical protein [Deinococcus yavapaiensis]|nr:hypothetical protein [Deinococcus yavapaiensis]